MSNFPHRTVERPSTAYRTVYVIGVASEDDEDVATTIFEDESVKSVDFYSTAQAAVVSREDFETLIVPAELTPEFGFVQYLDAARSLFASLRNGEMDEADVKDAILETIESAYLRRPLPE